VKQPHLYTEEIFFGSARNSLPHLLLIASYRIVSCAFRILSADNTKLVVVVVRLPCASAERKKKLDDAPTLTRSRLRRQQCYPIVCMRARYARKLIKTSTHQHLASYFQLLRLFLCL
jgi:hypothetical protein